MTFEICYTLEGLAYVTVEADNLQAAIDLADGMPFDDDVKWMGASATEYAVKEDGEDFGEWRQI